MYMYMIVHVGHNHKGLATQGPSEPFFAVVRWLNKRHAQGKLEFSDQAEPCRSLTRSVSMSLYIYTQIVQSLPQLLSKWMLINTEDRHMRLIASDSDYDSRLEQGKRRKRPERHLWAACISCPAPAMAMLERPMVLRRMPGWGRSSLRPFLRMLAKSSRLPKLW